MAIYHLSIKIISRGKGKSAVAAATYRAGQKITNEYDGEIHDYTRKGGIVHTEILLPDNAPAEYKDRAVLWNAVEKIEKAKNSQLAREIELALPVELTKEQSLFLVREYVKKHFVSAGMCADIAIHDKKDGNPHAHILLTMRPFNEDKTWGDKQKKEYILDPQGNKIYDKKKRSYKCKSVPTTDWNEQTKAEEWRAAWAEYVNGVLEHNNHAERIDHRSYERQGIEQIPTVHMGAAASQMEKRGIRTERGNLNREIEFTNKQIRQLRARINHLKNWLKEETENPTPPTLVDVISDILSGGESKTRYAQIRDLKEAAKVLNFLTSNHISTLPELQEKVKDFYGRQLAVNEKFKPIERRLKTLDEHLRHSENFKNYRGHKARYEKLYAEYKTLKNTTGFGAERKAQKALDAANEYRETYRPQIAMYENAEKYLRDVLQGRFDPKKLPPITKWKAERETLTAEKSKLYQEYSALKNEIREVEIIRKAAEQIARQIDPPKRTKAREMEL